MVNIEQLHSEVFLEGRSGETVRADDADKPIEVRIEELREIVRTLMAEEYESLLRVTTTTAGWDL